MVAQLPSRIDAVKVYAAGATVTRIAELNLPAEGLPEQVEISGLPLALDDSSVRVRVESSENLNLISLHAADIRIGLAVPPPPETPPPPLEEEVSAAKREVEKIENLIALIEQEIKALNKLQVPDRPKVELGSAPPPSPTNARLALTNFSDEQIRARMQEKRENVEKLEKAREHLADLQQKQSLASNAKNAKQKDLQKTAIVSLSYEGEAPVNQRINLLLEYFVPGARWIPTYVCRLNSAENTATIAVRSLICQQTGEDWSGVRLQLSTALPLSWCELPELSSLRIGKAQPPLKKAGWRKPPVGAEILFEDFDRQQTIVESKADKYAVRSFSLPSIISPLANLNSYWKAVDSTGKTAKLTEKTAKFRETRGLPTPTSASDDDYAELEVSFGITTETETSLPLSLNDSTDDLFGDLGQTSSDSDEFFMGSVDPSFDEEEIDQLLPLKERAQHEYQFLKARSPLQTTNYKKQASPAGSGILTIAKVSQTSQEISFKTDLLAYSLMIMGDPEDRAKRGKLSIEQRDEFYLKMLRRQELSVSFNIPKVIEKAVSNARKCLSLQLPLGGIDVRQAAGSFDYAYSADGRVDIPSNGQFHSVALTSQTTQVDVRYVVVPREDTNVFRIAQLRNPLSAPLLSGSADVYVDGEYILSTNITTVPPKGKMELGLGVEQAIKVARNTFYSEARSDETIVAFNQLHHQIKIELVNHLPREAKIEVRERIPIPQEGAKVDVQIEKVSPAWELYNQVERETPIQGGYRWRIKLPAKKQATLSVDYMIKTFVDNELVGGNRRE